MGRRQILNNSHRKRCSLSGSWGFHPFELLMSCLELTLPLTPLPLSWLTKFFHPFCVGKGGHTILDSWAVFLSAPNSCTTLIPILNWTTIFRFDNKITQPKNLRIDGHDLPRRVPLHSTQSSSSLNTSPSVPYFPPISFHYGVEFMDYRTESMIIQQKLQILLPLSHGTDFPFCSNSLRGLLQLQTHIEVFSHI